MAVLSVKRSIVSEETSIDLVKINCFFLFVFVYKAGLADAIACRKGVVCLLVCWY